MILYIYTCAVAKEISPFSRHFKIRDVGTETKYSTQNISTYLSLV